MPKTNKWVQQGHNKTQKSNVFLYTLNEHVNTKTKNLNHL